MLVLERRELGKGGAHRERGGVAGVDTDERGAGHPLRRLCPEPARHEVEHRFVVASAAADERLAEEPQLAARAEEIRLESPGGLAGKGRSLPAT